MSNLQPRRDFLSLLVVLSCICNANAFSQEPALLDWQILPPLPNNLGVAGPFVGIHNDAMIVAGGANFPKPIWESDKVWLDDIHVLTRNAEAYTWKDGGKLAQPIAYGASVSTSDGVVCIGGNDSGNTFQDVFLLSWNTKQKIITTTKYPSLPSPCAYAAATIIGNTIYLAGGQSGSALSSAMTNFWSLDVSRKDDPKNFNWVKLQAWPGPSRAFNLTVSQHNGYDNCVYVMSGRRQDSTTTQANSQNQADAAEAPPQFLKDVWEFNPRTDSWRQRANVPRCVMAGTAIKQGQSHVFVLGGATEELFFQTNELKDNHPGFVKKSLAYHTITNTWIEAGPTPANHVTTTAVRWGDDLIVPTGEVRPRVRSPAVFRVTALRPDREFGAINYFVLFGYLAVMVGVGFYCARKNRSTDDFFRGGKQIPWWAAGCSIFATMLSSLTFTGIPSKSFAQDWVYSIGNLMIPVVAVLAVFVAMPFYRRIDATSAYEYLEKRFSRSVRLFGSASFTLFHVFRMAVVMSLTGLALAVATPLTPAQSVLLMGVLSIAYSTMGGIEAVIWTDTIQTVVLLGGAVLAIIWLISGLEEGASEFVSVAVAADKFRIANFNWDVTNSQIALWVIIVGAIAQNTSSYTADQAVVQRYMTTADQQRAARSIWTNAALTIPATLLFFGIGTALFTFYQAHPEKLDPTITTDQVFPLFIAQEMPMGLAGLIVAGVFAAAQSTVSTSMNSTATTIVTDFLRPLEFCNSEAGYLKAARLCTLLMGVLGTVLGLFFVDPEIKSLFDTFIKIVGLFMGVLGGLFILGAATTKANATGAISGAFLGAVAMFCLWNFTAVNGYLYTASGIAVCVGAGYTISLLTASQQNNLDGLTIYTLQS